MPFQRDHPGKAQANKLRQVSEQEKTLLYALDIVSDGIWDWNIVTNVVNRSAGWYRMLGYPPDSLPRSVQVWQDLIHPDEKASTLQIFDAYMSGKSKSYQAIYRCRRYDGSYLWIQDRGRHVEFDPNGKPARMVGAHTDIHSMCTAQEQLREKSLALSELNAQLECMVEVRTAELREANDLLSLEISEVTRLSQTDDLTGIYNRRRFEDLLHQELRRVQRTHSPVSLIMLDVDNFKLVNDNYGHQSGDHTLIQIARAITSGLRQVDSFGRWGGEEFIILLPDSNLQHGLLLAKRIRDKVNKADYDHGLKITVSIGITQYISGEDPINLIRRADNCMYQSKRLKDTITASME
jgi:diguanylate cyclase (GGDEF)-like protein/PAS domain S-box-containing protein